MLRDDMSFLVNLIPAPYRMMAAAIAVAVVASVAFVAGWMVNGWRWEAKAADQLQEQLEAKAQYDKLAMALVKRYQEASAEKKVVYRTIKEKVYVETSGKLCLGSGAVRLWDKALAGENDMPSAATGAAEAASGASDTQVLANAVENFEQYEECRRQLNALIDWHEQ